MRKFIMLTLFILMAMGNGQATACVGKTLYIGVSSSAHEQLLAEMVSVLVTERTGTTVKILTYKDSREIYNAVKHGQVGLMIENTDHALALMGKPKENNTKAAYELVKKEYRKNLNLVWLEPFGSMPGASKSSYAPVITVEVLGNLPALPKLINKLTGILSDGSYARLVKSMKDDNKPKRVARDFLKARKLI